MNIYEETLKIARNLIEKDPSLTDWVISKFPELKESEDERVRKALVSVLKSDFENDTTIHGISVGDIIAWLEKQSMPQVRTGLEWVNTIDDACDKRYLEEYAHGEYCHEQSFKWGFQEGVDWLEKQGEQKSLDDIAKEVTKDKDAAISFLKSTGIINEKGELADEYKIEQDEQNSTWSEEDKDYYDAIISKLEVTQDDALLTDNQMKFLKSLKDRYTWKPSNEQMEGIECTIKTLRYQLNAGDNRLDSLYADLKKLREE